MDLNLLNDTIYHVKKGRKKEKEKETFLVNGLTLYIEISPPLQIQRYFKTSKHTIDNRNSK